MTPAALTVTANDQGMVYGSQLPALAASYSGFVNGDTSASLTTAPTLATTATAASPVGSYGIAAAGAVDANYSITYTGGTLTVTPAALTITANEASKVYGSPLPALTASYSGFVNGDTSASLTTAPTLTTSATAASPVGSYGIAAAGAVDANYSITYAGGTLTVTPAALTITANDQGKVYGSPLPALTASYSGFVNGDTSASLATAPTLTTTVTAASPVGSYGIAVSGAVDANYSITYAGGTLTVTPAALTITANDQGMVYGSPLPALTASYSGFVNGDTSASLTTSPTLTTTATASSHVGSYDIAASGAVDAELQHHLRGGHADGDPGRADDHGQRPGHGLRLAAAGAHGQLQRFRQWRHQRQLHDRAHADDDGHGLKPRGQLRHRGLWGRRRELQHHLRGGQVHRHPGDCQPATRLDLARVAIRGLEHFGFLAGFWQPNRRAGRLRRSRTRRSDAFGRLRADYLGEPATFDASDGQRHLVDRNARFTRRCERRDEWHAVSSSRPQRCTAHRRHRPGQRGHQRITNRQRQHRDHCFVAGP